MVKKDLISAGEFDKITALTKEAVETMLGFELRHIGINESSEGDAVALANVFQNAFGFGTKVGNSSVFAGTAIEVMKTPYLGTKGHIAIATNYIERAIYHLEKRGFEFDMDTVKKNAKGEMVAVYLKGEFGGFAVHLVQK